MANNKAALDKGFKKAKAIIDNHILKQLVNFARMLIDDGVATASYHNLTGNTLTSLAVGIYYKGNLRTVLLAKDEEYLKPPTEHKLSKGDGKGVWHVKDYDTGRIVKIPRFRLMETDEKYGFETSISFLKSYKSPSESRFGLVMCTGTEYSTYLEAVKDYNVLSTTFMRAKWFSMSQFKPLP